MQVEVIDLFCGVGGLTKGLSNAGLNVIAGFDNDKTCKYAYSHNNKSDFYLKDIRNVPSSFIDNLFSKNSLKVIVGCAPCQPFSNLRSKYKTNNQNDEKYNLLKEYGRIISEIKPTIISMENVPQITKTEIYNYFITLISQLGYKFDSQIINCSDYGISQGRKRFVLLGSLLGEIELIKPTNKNAPPTVKDYIYNLPPIHAGEVDAHDQLHQAASLSDKNILRIRASKPGGSWVDWPEELLCECHKKLTGSTYKSVYGRLKWDQIGPTITTQFYNYGTGRYGHPEQDRALSLREGALLQTFPRDYDFIDPNIKLSFRAIARHIGNAVPVKLGEVIGESIIHHIDSYNISPKRGLLQ